VGYLSWFGHAARLAGVGKPGAAGEPGAPLGSRTPLNTSPVSHAGNKQYRMIADPSAAYLLASPRGHGRAAKPWGIAVVPSIASTATSMWLRSIGWLG